MCLKLLINSVAALFFSKVGTLKMSHQTKKEFFQFNNKQDNKKTSVSKLFKR